MTIVHVYDELQASGLVERKKGSGTRVSTHKWGILPKGVTNWRKYIEGGSFLPTYPLIRRIREKSKQMENGLNLSSGELSADLFPARFLQDSFNEQTFASNLGYSHPQGHTDLSRNNSCLCKELSRYSYNQFFGSDYIRSPTSFTSHYPVFA